MNISFKDQLKNVIREVLSEELGGNYVRGIETSPRAKSKRIEPVLADRDKAKSSEDRRLKQNRAK